MSDYYVNTLYDRIISFPGFGDYNIEDVKKIIPKDVCDGVYEIIWDDVSLTSTHGKPIFHTNSGTYLMRLHKIWIEDYVVDGDLGKSDYIKLHYKWDGDNTLNDRIFTKAQLIKFDISKYRSGRLDDILAQSA